MQTALDRLQERAEISFDDVQNLLGIKRTRSFTLTKQMSDAGLIKIKGRGVNKKIIL